MQSNWNEDSRLKKIIMYAKAHSPYYQKRISDTILRQSSLTDSYDSIPVLTKDDLMHDADSLLSDEYKFENLIEERTSGSSGKIINVYWDKSCRLLSLRALWNERKKYNIFPFSKACYFHTITNMRIIDKDIVASHNIVYRDGGRVMSLSKMNFDENNLFYYHQKMKEFQPEWIMCHPNTLYLYTKFLQTHNIPPIKSIHYIEFTGELLLPAQRAFIEEYFNVVTKNHYGMREVNGIAYECEYGNMHILESNVFVDIRNENGKKVDCGQEGIVYVTGLTNKAMPIIKYKTNDRGLVRNVACKCGKSVALYITTGRLNDLIILPDDKVIEGNIFFYIVEYINHFYDNAIEQFYIIQKAIDLFYVTFVYKSKQKLEYFGDIQSLFIAKCEQYGIKSARWQFDTVDAITPCPNGKNKYFYCEVANKHQL